MQLVIGAGRLLDGMGRMSVISAAAWRHAVAAGAGLASGFAGTGFAGIGAVYHLGDAGANLFGGSSNLAGGVLGLLGRRGWPDATPTTAACGHGQLRRRVPPGHGTGKGIHGVS